MMRSSTQSAYPPIMTPTNSLAYNQASVSSKLVRETIHSGHFMVSDFEPESEVLDDEYEAGMPIPQDEILSLQGNQVISTKVTPNRMNALVPVTSSGSGGGGSSSGGYQKGGYNTPMSMAPTPMATIPHYGTAQQYQQHQQQQQQQQQQMMHQHSKPSNGPSGGGGAGPLALYNPFNSGISIDGSLTKLFQCMTLAYRQKLTSPKWNRFKGVRLRWKDKIRLNNVIWRCWHMQFILKQKALVCQFAPPLDVDQHNKPEAVVMEGKYWKRKLSTVAAEYKKWRLFYRNKIMGWTHHTATDLHPVSLDGFDWNRAGSFGGGPISGFVFDDDLLMDFSDTLFSSLSSQSVGFPNPRELTRSGMAADFIQPGLVQLQPSLDDFMDTLEPLQEEMDPMSSSDNLFNSDMMHAFGDPVPKLSGSGGYHAAAPAQQKSSYTASGGAHATTMASFYPLASIGSQNVSVAGGGGSSSGRSGGGGGDARLSPSSFYGNNQENSQGQLDQTRHDIFAVPNPKTRVKQRGRSRGSPGTTVGSPRGGGSSAGQTAARQPPETAQNSLSHHHQHQHLQQQHGQGGVGGGFQGQHSNNPMVNSRPTLLSHLLSNSGAAAGLAQQQQQQAQQQQTSPGGYGSGSSSGYDKMGVGGGSGSLVMQMGGVMDHQQQKPWNAKNANESLNPNMPLNFNKSMLQMDHDLSMNSSGSGGNLSPPMLTSTPSPPMGPPGLGGPGSPSKPFRPKNDTEREHRRVCHINAEQKRRCNIKNGFDVLHSLIPQLSHNPNAKVSKAAMLQKGAEYIRQLKLERTQLKQEIEAHRQEVDALNASINNCQSLLPATGAPVSRQRTNKMKEMFDQWVRTQTAKDWRFWIFSILIRPLLDSYNNSVSTASLDELCRTVLAWVDQHCSLVDLRPAVLNSLRYLCTTTDILTNPANLPEEARRAVNRQSLKIERSGSSSNENSR